MTLVLALMSRSWVLHTSDRLVTVKRRTRVSPHDTEANKSLIYLARDGWVALGYAGVAYIGDLPTDAWIAHQLIPDRDPDESGFMVGSSAPRRQLGDALRGLAVALQAELQRRPSAALFGGVTILASGWKLDRAAPFARPTTIRIHASGRPGESAAVFQTGKYWGWERGRLRWYAAGDLSGDPLADLEARILAHPATLFETDALPLMVDVTRRASTAGGGTIGQDCISIYMPPEPRIVVQYRPAHRSSSGPSTDYSPWVVAPGLGSMPPTRITHRLPRVSMGRLTIEFVNELPPAIDGPLSMRSAQRPAPPA